MVCGDGVALCGVLTLQTGLGQGAYSHPTVVGATASGPRSRPTARPSAPSRRSRRRTRAASSSATARRARARRTLVEFETHEWEKHGECAGVRDARAYLTTVCGLAEQPLQAMTAAHVRRRASHDAGKAGSHGPGHRDLRRRRAAFGNRYCRARAATATPGRCRRWRSSRRSAGSSASAGPQPNRLWAVAARWRSCSTCSCARSTDAAAEDYVRRGAARPLDGEQLAMLEGGDRRRAARSPRRRRPRGRRSLPRRSRRRFF